jgi:hypothetical protein
VVCVGCETDHRQVSDGHPGVFGCLSGRGLTCMTLDHWDSVYLPLDTSGYLAWASALSVTFSGPTPPLPLGRTLWAPEVTAAGRRRGCQSKPAPVTCRKAAGGGGGGGRAGKAQAGLGWGQGKGQGLRLDRAGQSWLQYSSAGMCVADPVWVPSLQSFRNP